MKLCWRGWRPVFKDLFVISARNSRIALALGAFCVGLALFAATAFFFRERVGMPAPSAVGGSFRLTDQDGKTVTDETMKGRPFLVFFGFTHCPDICPTTLF